MTTGSSKEVGRPTIRFATGNGRWAMWAFRALAAQHRHAALGSTPQKPAPLRVELMMQVTMHLVIR